MCEEWKDVAEFQDSYAVSTLGRVMNKKTGRILKANLSNKGYPVHYLQNGNSKTKKALLLHRMVAVAFIDNPKNLPHINHIDGCKTNFSISNLEWVSPKENTNHAIAMGMFVPPKQGKGEACRASKLNESQVIAIKLRLSNGDPYRRIANDYGVSYGTIGHIKYGRTWSHIDVMKEKP